MKKIHVLLLIVVIVVCAASLTACLSIIDVLNRIETYNVSKANISFDSSSYDYTGEAITPSIKVTLNSTTLKNDTDYTVTYSNNINAGTATVTITGRGSYTGTKTSSFTINPISLEGAILTLSANSYTYTSSSTQAKITSLKLGDKSLLINRDYVVRYTNNNSIGTATLTIVGVNNYTGTLTRTFEITPLNINDAVITLSRSKYKYTGEEIEPIISSVVVNDYVLDSSNYTISYSNNIEIGNDATITITGKANCIGSTSKTFIITDELFYTITFETYDSEGNKDPISAVASVDYAEGDQIEVPNESTIEKEGMTGLKGYSYVWYTTDRFRRLYQFGLMPAEDITIYGKLQKEQGYSFLSYDFRNANSINVSSENMLDALIDYMVFNYIDSDNDFYTHIGSASFDSAKSYLTISSNTLSSIKAQTRKTSAQEALVSYIEDYFMSSTFAANTPSGVTVNMGAGNSFKFYINYYVTDEAAIEGTLSATAEVLAANATNKNYSIYNTLNVSTTSGIPHTLAIMSAPVELEVSTSNQLAFALEHGVKPICVPGSKAEQCWNEAIEVLNAIINPSMSDYDKALAIYTWIITNVQYDYNCVQYSDTTNGFKLSQGDYWMYYDAYYLEGVFGLNNTDGSKIAVCDGMAKAFTLMCQMEGINCVRVTGSVSSGRTTGGHAWNRVYIDNQWYIVDPTWGGSPTTFSGSGDSFTGETVNYAFIFMAENDSRLQSRSCYANGDWTALYSIDYYKNSYFYVDYDGDGIDERYDYDINSVQEMAALWLYAILMKDSNGEYMNIDGYTIQFSLSGTPSFYNQTLRGQFFQTALTAAKAIAQERVGFEKNFNSAYQEESIDNDNTWTLLFTGQYTPSV